MVDGGWWMVDECDKFWVVKVMRKLRGNGLVER